MFEEKITVALKSGKGPDVPITERRLNRWLPIRSTSGKFGIIVTSLKGDVEVRAMEVWRKTSPEELEHLGIPIVEADLKTIKINNNIKDDRRFSLNYKLKRNDEIQIIIKDVSGNLNNNLVCNWYKEGEEFAAEPFGNNSTERINDAVNFSANYIFDFGNLEMDPKEDYYYFIKVIITRAVQKRDTVKAVVELPPDRLYDSIVPYQLLCSTPEGVIGQDVGPRLNCKPGSNFRQCFDIPLTDECSADIEGCLECESYWGFWIAAGREVINAHELRDNQRKESGKAGLVETYVLAERVKKVSGDALFPREFAGEDLFFAVVDAEGRRRFMEGPFDINNPQIGGIVDQVTYTSGGYKFFDHRILKYKAAEPLSLCVCNNNEMSSVPVLFKFQQFLIQPDSTSTFFVKIDKSGNEN